MIKNILCISILLLALPCAAQRNAIKGIVGKGISQQMVGRISSAELLRHARVAQGKILLNNYKPKAEMFSPIENYILRNVPPTDLKYLPIALYKPSQRQIAETFLLYLRVMQEFEQFKKEMDVLLYYQSKPNERRQIPPAEQEAWGKKIREINARLGQLKDRISPHDPAYYAARQYMIFAAESINPMLRGMLEQQRFARSDRKYVTEEFFLETPKGNKDAVWTSWLPSSVRTYQTARHLPAGLRMAILNDRPSVLARIQEEHRNSFCPNWKLATYENTEDLLQDIRKGAKFDLILTDIIVPGGGGYYLVSTLREKGFNGAILAMSAYPEEDELGRTMFNRGFDGMISASVGFEMGKNWPREIMKRIQNYFYYRDLHGWNR